MKIKCMAMYAASVLIGSGMLAYGDGSKLSNPMHSEALKGAIMVEDAFAELAEKAKPAVVVITNKQSNSFRRNIDGIPDEFFDFWNMPRGFNRGRRQDGRRAPQPVGHGSGVIVRPEGYIVTNYHVIKDNEYLEVKTADGKVYDNMENADDVKVVGYDEESDLAVLKIGDGKKKDYPLLSFGDSERLRVGQWAIAIGAPYNLDYSVTIGCVSQKGRTDMGMSTFDSYIQTDASINPGNSGGPLLNIRGEIIGINQFIVNGGAGGSVGIGFAIASNLAKQITDILIEDGEVIRPFLGITMQELSRGMKSEFDIDYGVMVREVIENESADKAGVKAGDIILSVGGKKVKTSHELLMEVTRFKPGDSIELGLKRGDKMLKISVKAGRRDEYLGNGHGGKPGRGGNADSMMKGLGLQLSDADGKVIVRNVVEGGAADLAGNANDDRIQPGDIIIDINRIPVGKVSDVKKILSELKKNTVIVYLQRKSQGGDYKYFIAINLADKK